MFRVRMAGTLVAAVALLAAACGGEGGEIVTPDIPQDQAETPAGATSTTPDDSSEASEAAEGDTPEGSATGSDEPDDAGSAGDLEVAAPADPEALLAAATTQLDGRSVRGEATIDLGPGVKLSMNFESDADGDLAVTVELPPGLDPEFPDGGDRAVRYVGGVIYVRPLVSAETLAELAVDEAWYVAEPAAGGDPMSDAMGSAGGVMCVFPQEPFAGCDLLAETGTFLEVASEAEIVGREDVRGTGATRVRFQISLLELVGEAFGGAPDAGEAGMPEGDDFDDGESDPFEEGFEQFFEFLDTGFEVDVWIDDENLIRRLTFDLASMLAGFAGPDEEIPSNRLTLEFYDFDADISVDAPPPEAIIDDPDLLRGDDDYASGGEYEPEYDDEYDDDGYN